MGRSNQADSDIYALCVEDNSRRASGALILGRGKAVPSAARGCTSIRERMGLSGSGVHVIPDAKHMQK
jgi:hypothetical protein